MLIIINNLVSCCLKYVVQIIRVVSTWYVFDSREGVDRKRNSGNGKGPGQGDQSSDEEAAEEESSDEESSADEFTGAHESEI